MQKSGMAYRLLRHRISYQVYYWLAFTIILSMIIGYFTGLPFALKLCVVIILPVIPPVYLHFYIFNTYFIQRKFTLYIIWLIVILAIFSFLAQYIADVFVNKDGNYYGGYLDPILFILITTGMRAYSEKLKDKYLIQEAITKQTQIELKLQETEAKHVKAELELLKSQVNPHFLFNTLNSIYSFALDNSHKTANSVMKLSDLMRYLLESSKKKLVPLQQECDFIENYIALEKVRLGSKCKITYETKGEIEGKNIPPMLLIPFIENSFKHGIGISTTHNYITISLSIDNNNLNFSIENNIPPQKNTMNEMPEKTGIKNVKRRLELLYPGKHKLDVFEKGSTFKVALTIAL